MVILSAWQMLGSVSEYFELDQGSMLEAGVDNLEAMHKASDRIKRFFRNNW